MLKGLRQVTENIRGFIYSEITLLHFLNRVELLQFMLQITSEQYGHKAWSKVYASELCEYICQKNINEYLLFFVKITISKVNIIRLPL